MSPRPAPPCLSTEEAAARRRIRRHAVTRTTIEQATERRLAGDWRGACAAARVDLALDLAEVAFHCGRDVADALTDDLRHLVPDLLHWHLPRLLGGWTTLDTYRTVVLARYRPVDPAERPGTTPYLYVTTPAMREGPQRVTLRFGTVLDERAPGVFGRRTEDWRHARHLWDARHTAALRERCGGGHDRLPFLRPDGTPLAADELPTADPGPGDPVARAEWITTLHQSGEPRAAFAAAGIDADLTPPSDGLRRRRYVPEAALGRLALDHTRLEREVRGQAGEGAGHRFVVAGDRHTDLLLETPPSGGTGLRVRLAGRALTRGLPFLAEARWRRLPDLDLLRDGGITAEHLHPLVRDALFPALRGTGGPGGPPGPEAPALVRVRCRGEWHEVGFRPGGGLLRMPHSDEEQRREQALRAFGGAVTGCFAVRQTWTSGEGRLPEVLRAQRRELFLRAQHGDTHGVLALLDLGMDPRVRDASGRTLLHVLHLLDHETLLPRLLAYGLDLEARDQRERTPLFTAVNDGGSRALVEALVAAGARLDVVDESGFSLAQIIRRYRRTDLAHLRERVHAEHPDLGVAWLDRWLDEKENEKEREKEDEKEKERQQYGTDDAHDGEDGTP
ncbi:ankyrin repeat domain-containing protein [Streptomyces sp. NPDC057197]|uniref:ankyrin repeat domain-containing protein n=1 Tax=Streptomyces sp. NPDC057197 TaxID=3346045 RepID=UPI00362F29A0